MALALGLVVTNIQAQTNTPGTTLSDVFKFLGASSNFTFAAYGLYDTTTKTTGAGFAGEYMLSPYVGAVLRLDYLNKDVYEIQGNLQFQYPIHFSTNSALALVPFTFAGVGTPIAGKGSQNGSVVGVASVGAALRLSQHLDFLVGYERWTGAGFNDNVIGAGLAWKF